MAKGPRTIVMSVERIRRALSKRYRRLPVPILNVAERFRDEWACLQIEAAGPPELGIMRVTDRHGQSIHICRLGRVRRFRPGILNSVAYLANVYCLSAIDLGPGGVFIDCGANIGELGLWARARGFSYIPFEPEESEAVCCDLNNFEGSPETWRIALWNETTRLPFYSKPESADSSLFEIAADYKKTEIEVSTLDSLLDPELLSNATGPVVLKVEAEGAEPEVLQGAERVVSAVDWVTIDCGYERGMERDHTFVETNNFMQDHGFRLCQAKFDRVVALYRSVRSQR